MGVKMSGGDTRQRSRRNKYIRSLCVALSLTDGATCRLVHLEPGMFSHSHHQPAGQPVAEGFPENGYRANGQWK